MKIRDLELLKGKATFEGEILGGCLESLYQIFDERYEGAIELCAQYQLFPSLSEWAGKILLLETSEGKTRTNFISKNARSLKGDRDFFCFKWCTCWKTNG